MAALRRAVGILMLVMCSGVARYAQARPGTFVVTHDALDFPALDDGEDWSLSAGLKFLVPPAPLMLPYHNGPILSGDGGIPVYVIWYGSFRDSQKSIVKDLFASFSSSPVGSWWNLTGGYKDSAGKAVSSSVVLGGEVADSYSLGKTLTEASVEKLVVNSLSTFAADSNGVYLVLTAADVAVDGFCTTSCASHFVTRSSAATGGLQLPYAWVGNSAGSSDCSGLCAWPYATHSQYGPPGFKPLLPPNADVGMDGMVINIGAILAGTATDPFATAFYEGDASAPLEAASACPGIFGAGAYSGFPGQLLLDPATGPSYNVNGINGRKYLLPALWDPVSLACVVPA